MRDSQATDETLEQSHMASTTTSWKLTAEQPSGRNADLLNRDESQFAADPDPLLVCIVDNDAGVRDSLSFLIESEHIPVATFASAREFLKNWQPERTGCVVVDIRMPMMSGLELQAELARRNIKVPLIIITGFGDVQMAVQAMKKGAFDFFEKPIHHQLLLDRLHQALESQTAAREESHLRVEFQRRYALLTPTQRQVLTLVVSGRTSQEISQALGCKEKTVETHRKNIYLKLGCKNVAGAINMVRQQRIIEEESP